MSATTPPVLGANSYDAIVVGAGVAGLVQVNRLRAMGLKVKGIEAGSNVGGTWDPLESTCRHASLSIL